MSTRGFVIVRIRNKFYIYYIPHDAYPEDPGILWQLIATISELSYSEFKKLVMLKEDGTQYKKSNEFEIRDFEGLKYLDIDTYTWFSDLNEALSYFSGFEYVFYEYGYYLDFDNDIISCTNNSIPIQFTFIEHSSMTDLDSCKKMSENFEQLSNKYRNR